MSGKLDLNQMIQHPEFKDSVVQNYDKDAAADRHIRLAKFYATLAIAGLTFVLLLAGLVTIYLTSVDPGEKGWVQSILLSVFFAAAVALGIKVTGPEDNK